ncbi:putative 3-ketoacyl-CoA thiolase/acetyl-CoA acetyltransferase [Parvularcula bermudensis HTCC2503]|uniref:Putative 3-ketoacyl-CoA thiolase/acetyl-CoA acetyltransferase n=1 Tax=Parvularcula bermudensis (strain ATCC BAA-594 / HTCC2503 / KCTC 12087) TaxID=314260 RepID=E0TBZ4_PARBH|nr:acetyl-CoA C-acyltransferase [Parvularcula bermudensis]ADM08487.1 putative 3-ketoacyl-CoA thiolase/acetyl-CoA acetyltransferase [Parvularcula bermudensis HTCC2503]
MREAVIVSFARTPIGKAYRGAFNNTGATELAGHALKHAVDRAKIDPERIEDVVMGEAMQYNTGGFNLGRNAALRAGLPMSVPGQTMDRQCGSGMMAIATAAKQIIADNMDVCAAGGAESISTNQGPKMPTVMPNPWLLEHIPQTYMTMIETAEIVSDRYDIKRELQDEYGYQSQQRTAAAQEAGYFDDEIVPMSSVMIRKDKETGETSQQEVTLEKDEGNRPQTTLEGLNGLSPVFKGGQRVKEGSYITAGNASQLSDGAAAVVLMERKAAEQAGLEPLGAYRGMAVAGTDPDEMGIGPVFAIPKLLEKNGLSIDDIGLWELNEAFACQVVYCRDKLGIPNDRLNVDGGAISVGHPYGMSGARMVGHALLAGKRLGAKYIVSTMCVGGGQGAAGLFEVY